MLSKFQEDFKVDAFKSYFWKCKAEYILQNKELYLSLLIDDHHEGDDKYDPMKNLEDFVKLSGKNDYVLTQYKKAKNSCKIGRYYSIKASIQRMSRKIRHTICDEIYIDIDMCNAHVVITVSLCEKHGFNCVNLRHYCNNREKYLDLVVKKGLTKDEAKQQYLTVLNGGHSPYVSEEFLQECRCINELIATHKDYKDIYKMKQNEVNKYAKAMNVVLCKFENDILIQTYKFLKEHNVILNDTCELIFDGLQVLYNEENYKLLCNDNVFLNKLDEYIYMNTGIPMKFKVKPFDEKLPIPDNYKDTLIQYSYIDHGDDDIGACKIILNKFSDRIKYSRNKLYIKTVDNLWSDNHDIVKNIIFNMITECNILYPLGDDMRSYSSSHTKKKNCYRDILTEVQNFCTDEKFYDQLFNSNLYHLAFKDCIYSFKERKTFCYNDVLHICFSQKISYDFPDRDEDKIKEVYDRIINPIFTDEEQRKSFLTCVSRGIAGHYKDKDWMLASGVRNSGKSLLADLMKNTFECFVNLFSCECLIKKKQSNNNSDPFSKLGWLIDLQYSRLNISQECVFNNGDYLDGNTIKKLTGGDIIQGRKLFENKQDFRLQGTFLLCGNVMPDIIPPDATETLIPFYYGSKFVDEDKFKTYEGLDLKQIQKKDNTIKEWIINDDVKYAFLHIILDHYVETKPPRTDEMITSLAQYTEDTSTSIEDVILNYVCNNDSNDNVYTSKDIIDFIDDKEGVENICTSKGLMLVMKLYKLGQYGLFRVNGKVKRGFKGISLLDG